MILPLQIVARQWRQLLHAAKRAWIQSLSAVVKGKTLFIATQAMGMFYFWRNAEFTFFPAPFSQSPPSTQSSALFCTYIQFFHYYIRCIQWSKKYDKIGAFAVSFVVLSWKEEVLIWGTWEECLDLLLRSSIRS